MRASRTDRPRRLAGLAVLPAILLLAGGPAAAQLGPPVSLLPQPAAPAAPAEAAPGAAAPGADQAGSDQDNIQAAPLKPIDPSWDGVLGPEQGAFPPTMWRGTPRALVAAALPQLAPTTSRTLQNLAGRLLLSKADAPAGQDPPGQPSLADLRLDRLLALGDVSGALAIVELLPADSSGDAIDRDRVELQFAAGNMAAACQTVADRVARYQDPWWARALIACQALNGDGAKASLGLSLLREEKVHPDAVFDSLIDALSGHPHKFDKLPDPDPLRVTLLAALKQPLPQEALAEAGPAALLAYASSDSVPVERRLAAAERAALFGAMTPDALGALYQKVEVKPDEQVAALKDGRSPEDPKSRAILYGVARSSAPAATRAAAVAALLAEARKRGTLPLTAQLLLPVFDELRPEGATADFAGDAARALLAAGRSDAADKWIAVSGSKALVLLRRLAAPPVSEEDPSAMVHDGIAALASRDSAAAPAQVGLMLALLAAFDEKLGALDWAPLLTPPHQAQLPSAALWIDQAQAMADKRVGETILASLLLARSGDHLTQEPIILGRVIAGLRAAGVESDARALAVEAALAAGV